jgi:hypothetical protein
MTITGRTNWFSNNGQLTYRVLDAGNAMIGSGTIPVKGAPGERGSFNGQVLFTEPSNGGTIRVELSDPSNGSNITTAIQLNVAPPPPPQIVIDSPPPGRQVGSPMMITGHTTYVPNGQLSYRVRDAAGNVIGQGGVPFAPNGRQANLTASLTFTEPTVGGNIVLEVFGPSPVASTMISTSITFYVAPLQRTSISASTQIPISTPTPNSSAGPNSGSCSIHTDRSSTGNGGYTDSRCSSDRNRFSCCQQHADTCSPDCCANTSATGGHFRRVPYLYVHEHIQLD